MAGGHTSFCHGVGVVLENVFNSFFWFSLCGSGVHATCVGQRLFVAVSLGVDSAVSTSFPWSKTCSRQQIPEGGAPHPLAGPGGSLLEGCRLGGVPATGWASGQTLSRGEDLRGPSNLSPGAWLSWSWTHRQPCLQLHKLPW